MYSEVYVPLVLSFRHGKLMAIPMLINIISSRIVCGQKPS